MEKLISKGLFGQGLIRIDNQKMIDRYNDCLRDIGIKTTSLSIFHIDAWGWSPEIANEMNDKFYLSYGVANPFAIILTPLQENSPIYFPYHSFDWDLTKAIFNKYRKQIEDITTESGLWFEVNQELSSYRVPQDLLLIDAFTIRFNTPTKLIQAAQKQRALVREFYEDKNAWAKKELQEQLIESASNYGDLRFRSIDIPPYPYTFIRSFYTKAFKGTFVFKDTRSKKPLLVLENNQSEINNDANLTHSEYNINDIKLYHKLLHESLIEEDLSFYQTDVYSLERVLDCILMTAINKEYPSVRLIEINETLKKRYIAEFTKKELLSEEFYDIERLIFNIKSGKIPDIIEISNHIRPYLCFPNRVLQPSTRQVIWQLITKMNHIDLAMLYLFDKDGFFTQYQSWNPNFQEWAIELVSNNQNLYQYIINKR